MKLLLGCAFVGLFPIVNKLTSWKTFIPLTPEYFVFTLYVKDRSAASSKVHERLANLCFELLPGKYVIRVVDIRKNFDEACERNILATPSIVTNLPGKIRVFVGDLQNETAIRLAIERAK